MTIEVNIRAGLDRALIRGLRPLLRRVGQVVLRREAIRGKTLSILLTGNEEMRELNRRWRRLDRTTDVLSFEGGGDVLGDVVISLEQAARQAERLGVPLHEEMARLLIHGVLHLLGHDHQTPAQRRAMGRLTEEILRDVV